MMGPKLFGKSKRGMLILTLAMLGVLIGFIAFLVISAGEAAEREQRFIGEDALAILRADQKAQLVLAYLDMAALFAAREGIFLLAEYGGIVTETPCGVYAGYSVWQAPVGDDRRVWRCAPEHADDQLSMLISRLIDIYAQNLRVLDEATRYETYQLPIDNYRITMLERDGRLDVIGTARDDLYFQVRRDRVVAYVPQQAQPSTREEAPLEGEEPSAGAQEAGENVIVGDYTIDPAFRVSIDYDLDDYAALQDAILDDAGLVARVEECERHGDALDVCLPSVLDELNAESPSLADARMTIIDGACDPEENIKSDLVEGYIDCAASEDTACTCSVRLEQAQRNDRTPVQITLTKGRPEHVGRDVSSQIEAIATHTVRGLDASAIFSEGDEIRIDVPSEGKSITLYKEEDTIYYVQDGSASAAPSCTMQKRTFKFCARKEGAGLWRLLDGELVRQSPQYKFALTLPDGQLQEIRP